VKRNHLHRFSLAVYKTEYYKNGSPKYAVKNRLVFMEYSEDLVGFNVGHQGYKYFAHAGHSFIESAEKALRDIPS
jgi:hypothetical protein